MSDLDACFYCSKPVFQNSLEWDHAPVPKNLGGTDVVPTCKPCHDLKDRLPLHAWPVDLMVKALDECGPLGRIFLAKSFAVEQHRAAGAASARTG